MICLGIDAIREEVCSSKYDDALSMTTFELGSCCQHLLHLLLRLTSLGHTFREFVKIGYRDDRNRSKNVLRSFFNHR